MPDPALGSPDSQGRCSPRVAVLSSARIFARFLSTSLAPTSLTGSKSILARSIDEKQAVPVGPFLSFEDAVPGPVSCCVVRELSGPYPWRWLGHRLCPPFWCCCCPAKCQAALHFPRSASAVRPRFLDQCLEVNRAIGSCTRTETLVHQWRKQVVPLSLTGWSPLIPGFLAVRFGQRLCCIDSGPARAIVLLAAAPVARSHITR